MTHSDPRIREVAEYLGGDVAHDATLEEAAHALGCDLDYLAGDAALPDDAVTAIGRLGDAPSERDRDEARRFALYLLHATD